MTAPQKNSEYETPADDSEEIKAALKKARNEAKSARAKAKVEEKARLKAEKALSEAQEDLQSVQAEIKEEREARIGVERTLAEVQEDLKAAQDEIRRERQARASAEQARNETEKALTEKIRSLQVEAVNSESPAIEVEENGAEQRVSFVVRLTVDEHRQPKRTEIEHPLSGKKETFPSLDAQRMAAFMKACISPPPVSVPTPIAELTPTKAEVAKPEPKMPATTLTVSSVQVFRADVPDVPALFLTQDEAFLIKVRFQLDGPEALSITANEAPFEMRVYTGEAARGGSSLLKTYRANLVKDVLEYSTQMQVTPGLPTGVHRLFTLVVLYEPVKMINHYEGPIIKVSEERSSVNPVITMELRSS